MAEHNPQKNRGWQVVMAGTGINLALGVLYAWSIFKEAIVSSIKTGGPGAFTWELASVGTPYAVCCLAFAFAMILAGKAQDKIGPAKTALIGGLMVGAGFILPWVYQFLYGMDYGLRNPWRWWFWFWLFQQTTPPAVKWFTSAKTGLVAGIVVSGFGIAPVYIAPLAKYLLGVYGIQQSMMILGVAFPDHCLRSFVLPANPPKGFVPHEVLRGYYPALEAEKKRK